MIRDKQVWTLEDDPGIRFVYDEVLSLRFHLRQFADITSFTKALAEGPATHPNVLLADVRLGNDNFLTFLVSPEGELIRGFPFFIVSSVDDVDALRIAFDHGAADYLTKPFGRGELIVKTERALAQQARRASQERDLLNQAQRAVNVDATSLRVFRGTETSIPLTSKEFQIFNLLHVEYSEGVPRHRIIERVWGDVVVTPKTLDVHLFNLRRKLAPIGMDVYRTQANSYRLLSLMPRNASQPFVSDH